MRLPDVVPGHFPLAILGKHRGDCLHPVGFILEGRIILNHHILTVRRTGHRGRVLLGFDFSG